MSLKDEGFPAGGDVPPARDMVMSEGQQLVFGDTTITPVAIPGHTAGSMGFIFAVKDGAATHTAALFGGSILNPQRRFPASLYEEYLKSIRHFADVTQRQRVDVELMNHPIMDGLFERLGQLRTRKPGAGRTAACGLLWARDGTAPACDDFDSRSHANPYTSI